MRGAGGRTAPVILNSQIAKEEGRFTIDDVIDGLCRKMVRRHPHVFGGVKGEFRGGRNRLWNQIKMQEKGQKTLEQINSKADINDRVSLTRIKTVRTCFFGSGLGGKH